MKLSNDVEIEVTKMD